MTDLRKGPGERTLRYRYGGGDAQVRRVLMRVYDALQEKGYDPVSQLVGYLMSGDPTYITSFGDARKLIRTLECDQVLEMLIREFVDAAPMRPEELEA